LILTEKSLRQWEESTCTRLTTQQRKIILDRLSAEPEPHEWTEQDIAELIRKICLEHPAIDPKVPARV